jgi:hypothetical protein
LSKEFNLLIKEVDRDDADEEERYHNDQDVGGDSADPIDADDDVLAAVPPADERGGVPTKPVQAAPASGAAHLTPQRKLSFSGLTKKSRSSSGKKKKKKKQKKRRREKEKEKVRAKAKEKEDEDEEEDEDDDDEEDEESEEDSEDEDSESSSESPPRKRRKKNKPKKKKIKKKPKLKTSALRGKPPPH